MVAFNISSSVGSEVGQVMYLVGERAQIVMVIRDDDCEWLYMHLKQNTIILCMCKHHTHTLHIQHAAHTAHTQTHTHTHTHTRTRTRTHTHTRTHMHTHKHTHIHTHTHPAHSLPVPSLAATIMFADERVRIIEGEPPFPLCAILNGTSAKPLWILLEEMDIDTTCECVPL